MELSVAILTPQGSELAPFCAHQPNMAYLAVFADWLAQKNCKLTLAPIIATDADGRMHYSRDAVMVIAPAIAT